LSFFDTLEKNVNIKLNKQQKEAVSHLDGPALVLAGPGSGKTTVIICRLAHMIFEWGIEPSEILSMTFNKAAAIEMRNRFARVFGKFVNQSVRFSTLHSFAYSVLRDYERSRNMELTLIEGNEGALNKRNILKKIYFDVNNAVINDDQLENLINEIGFVKNKMLKSTEGLKMSSSNFRQIFEKYEKYKKDNLLVDFDDMLTYAYSILKRDEGILNKYVNRYKYIQIDEGQDLSKVQFEIIKLLAERSKNLFVVADDDQSIYGFRGAEPEYILNFGRDFTGAKIFYLEKNYRSTKNIVEISSEIIAKNTQRYSKKHYTDNEYGTDPVIINVKDEYEQLDYLVKALKKTLSGGKRTAVLYRNNLSSILLVEMFLRSGIDYCIGENKTFFFNHWFVTDIIAFLKFALDQSDMMSFERIYYKMNRYISKSMIEFAKEEKSPNNVIEKILKHEKLQYYQRIKINELRVEFDGFLKMTPYQALQYIEYVFGYMDNAKSYCEKSGYSFNVVKDMMTILKIIAGGYNTLFEFLERLEFLKTEVEGKTRSQENNAVILSTVHSSKGLEYDVVYMIDLIDGEFPGQQSIDEEKKNKGSSLMEEERRLFYVGMTRAKEELYLVYPNFKNGESTTVSTFIREVEDCVRGKKAAKVKCGCTIRHKVYGEGKVLELIESGASKRIRVDFKGIVRLLDLIVCLDNNIINI